LDRRARRIARRAFPQIVAEPYFAECFEQGVEERHAEEALAVMQTILCKRSDLVEETLRDARLMARALDGIWHGLEEIVANAG
jgi:hypothetical protein